MTDIVLRIQGTSAAASAAVKSFRDQLASLREMVVSVGTEQKQQSTTAVEAARAQIAAEKEKVNQYRAEIAAIKEVTGAYAKGSDERKIAAQSEIAMQRRLQAALGETAAVAARGGRARAGGNAERDASGFARGAASRSGVVGAGLSALAGPGFLAGAIIGGGLDLSVKAAEQEQAAQANLRNALKDTGNARKTSTKQLQEYLAAEEHATGFTRDQVTQTMSMLIRSTGSLTTARRDEAVMANIARARQTDLSGAYMLVVRASEGNVGSLKRLGIEVPKVTKYEDELRDAHVKSTSALKEHAKQLDLAATKTAVMRAVTQKFAGDSAAYMHTFGGETATLKNTFHDLEVELGEKAIPMLTRLFGWIQKEIEAAKQSKTVHEALRQIIAILRVAWDGAVTVVKTAEELLRNKLIRTVALVTAGMLALTAAVEANPWVALTVAALLAVGEIQKHWGAISGWFDKLWSYIDDTGKAAWAFIVDVAKSAVYLILQYATAGIQGILEVASHLPFVGHKAKEALDSIQGYINQFRPDFSNVVDAFGNAGTEAGNAFAGNAQQGIAAAAAGLAGGPGTASPAVRNARGIGGGTQFGIVTGAKRLGVGSGGRYKKAGGHSGVATPGTMLDCSGYVYQVFTQAGFKGFPGTSETQWATKSGPNWTSVVIDASEAKPGDVVFMVGSPEYPSPGHVGIVTDGAGAGATVMQYYQTGMPPDTIQLGQIGDLVGVKRFYLGVRQTTAPSKPTSPDAGATTAATVAAFQKQLAAAPKTGAKKGLTAASETTLLGSITALLGTVPKGQLDSVQREAVAQIKKIRDSLHVGMSADELAKDKVALAKWGKALRDDVSEQGRQFTESGVAAKFKAAVKTALQAFQLDVLPAGQEAKLKGQIAALQKLIRQAAQDGQISPTALRNIKVSWSAMSSEMSAAASAVKSELQRQWQDTWSAVTNTVDRGITEAWQQTQQTFDRATQATLTRMQRAAAAQITQMQRAFQAQMTQFDRETTAGLNSLVVAQTPEEQALSSFQAQRAASQLAQTQATEQSDLAAAIVSGDPAKIKAAQDAIEQTLLDIQQAALQKSADDSRKAQDEKTTQQQQAYQDQRDALKQSLTDQEAQLEQSYQDSADAAATAYSDQRAAQWQHLNDMHDDQVTAFNNDLAVWGGWINDKQRSYAAFLAWIAANPVSAALAGQLPTSFQMPGYSGLPTFPTPGTGSGGTGSGSTGTGTGAGTLHTGPKPTWEGGIHLRPTVRMLADQGPEATFPLTSIAGGRAMKQLADAVVAAGGGGGGGTTIYGTFLGATERQVGRALKSMTDPARLVTYPAPPL